jgi:dolichol-phosphate mannosyltransferase
MKQTAIVIIPTYNERENIQKVIPLLVDVFTRITHWQMEILVVDDSSPDKTADIVSELQKKYKNVHLLVNQHKSGLGGAYLKGMEKAFGDLKADVVFEFDADLSHDPQKIPAFLSAIDQGADMVLGSRYIPGGGIPDDWGIHRKFLSVIGNIIIMVVLTDFRIRDWTGGYRAITKKVYQAVSPEMHSEKFSGYTFQIGFLHKAVKKGFKIKEVPFKFLDRTIGESKMGMEYIKNTLLYILKVRIKDILSHRVFKFLMAGGMGAMVQFIALALWRHVAPYQLAYFLAVECAVVSNFIINNVWTFADRKLKVAQLPGKFVQFNLASSGSIIIQQIIAFLGEKLIGTSLVLLILPIINFKIDTGMAFAVVGILIGMFWNFFAYNFFIWKKKPVKGKAR